MMKLLFRLSILIMILSSCTPGNNWRSGILTDEFIFEEAPFPSCHSATIAETPEGLVAAWFGGTHERNPDVGIWVSRQGENGWSVPEEVANGVMNDTLRYPTWNPVLYQIPEGDLMLFYKIGPSPSAWQGWYKTSSDNGKTWSEALMMPEGYIGPVKNKPVLLPDSILLCGSSTEGDGWHIHFETTTDFGKTWSKTGPINNSKVYSAIQPAILDHGDGKLQILSRSKNAVVATSWSEDYGKSWSLMQASGLPNNNAGLDAVTLEDGRHVIAYNHVKTPQGAKKGHRTPLNISVSKDGKTWEAALVLEDSEISQYSYPSVIQASDGLIHVVYTWRRERIKHVVIDPGQLKTKQIINEKWPE